jgi:hypothetical protein
MKVLLVVVVDSAPTLPLRTGDDNFFLLIAPADKEMVNKSKMKLQRLAIILDSIPTGN